MESFPDQFVEGESQGRLFSTQTAHGGHNDNNDGDLDEIDPEARSSTSHLNSTSSSHSSQSMPCKLRSIKTVLTRRADEWMQDRFAGLSVQKFGEEDIVIYSTHAVEPPSNFRSVWNFVGDHHRESRLSRKEAHDISYVSAVLIFCDTQADDHMQDALAIASSIQSLEETWSSLPPPVLLLHHSMSPEFQPDMEEADKFREEADWFTATNSGFDDIILEEYSGLQLVGHVRSRIFQISQQSLQVSSKVLEQQRLLEYAEEMEANIGDVVWEYLRVRLVSGIPPVDDDIPPGIPESLDDLVVGRKIGVGTFGSVYRLHHPDRMHFPSGDCVKVMGKEHLSSFQGIASLKRQIATMELLSAEGNRNPNIAQFHQAYHTHTHIIFRMEDAGQLSLFRLLSAYHEPLTHQNARSLLQQCISGLHHMHVHVGIVHRDIKPENLVIDEAQNGISVKYVDFDTCSKITAGMRCRRPIGTFPFLSPESMVAEKYDPIPSDIWSLGVVFLETVSRVRILDQVLSLSVPKHGASRAERFAAEKVAIEQIRVFFDNNVNLGKLLDNHVRSELKPMIEDTHFLLTGMLTVKVADRWAASKVLEASDSRFVHT